MNKLSRIRFRYSTVLLFIMFCIVPIISILMIHHLSLIETLSKIGTGVLGQSSVILKIDGMQETDDIIKSIDSNKTDIAIYLDRRDENGVVRYMYFNRKYSNLPMKEGRFFKESDLKTDNYQCVIGINRMSQTYQKGKNMFIRINDYEYEVIGVVGYEKPTILDNYIFVNMCTLSIDETEIITYDFLKISDSENIIDKIIAYYNNRNINAEKRSETASFSENVIPKFISARWFILLLVICFIGICLISMKWIEQQKRDLSICRLVGASISDVSILMIIKYLFIFICSFVVGVVYCNIIYPAYFSSLLTGYQICLGYIFILLCYSVLTIARVKLEEEIQ